MIFDTGRHETTYGLIQKMGRLDFTNKEVIDEGTATAILAKCSMIITK